MLINARYDFIERKYPWIKHKRKHSTNRNEVICQLLFNLHQPIVTETEMLISEQLLLLKNMYMKKESHLSRNCLFGSIDSWQCYELTRRCSPLPLMLASPFTFAVFPWSLH